LLVQTTGVLARVSRDLGGSLNADGLYHRIRTQVYQSSNVMTIHFFGTTPKQAVRGANAVADEVVDQYRTIATSRYDTLAADIKRQLERRQADLRQLDAELQKATVTYPYAQDASGSAEGVSASTRLGQLQGERDELLAKLSGDTAQASVTSDRKSEAMPLARAQAANGDPVYRNLRERFGRDAADLSREQTEFAPNYPGLPELRDIVGRERAGLDADERQIAGRSFMATQPYADALGEENRARSLVANDRAKLDQLEQTIAMAKNQLSGSTSARTTISALRRERQSAEAAYQLLSTRLITTLADRAAAASTGSVMVFDHATYAAPSPYTRPVLVTTAVMIVAVWIAMTLALVLEGLARRFRTPVMIERVYGAPVLGVVR
jgi:capsular polysaccharide biosynthesis protein